MTLSRFLRNYVYVPLGGNRRGTVRRYANLLATMLLGGLWHGAGWTFVIWGALHGLYLCLNHLLHAFGLGGTRPAGRGAGAKVGAKVGAGVGAEGGAGFAVGAAGWALTFAGVVVGWVFFRAASVPAALQMLGAMTPGLGDAHAVHTDMQHFGWLAVGLAAAVALLLPTALELAGYTQPAPSARPVAARPVAARLRAARGAPALAAVLLGVVAAFCVARLPDPGIFLYFNF